VVCQTVGCARELRKGEGGSANGFFVLRALAALVQQNL
jgi:hypothetical protein